MSSRKKNIDELLEHPELSYFDNNTFALEYLVIFNDFLLKPSVDDEALFKFMHFSLIKEFEGDISFYQAKDQDLKNLNCLYSGHQIRKPKFIKEDFEVFEEKGAKKWVEKQLPWWSDETFQDEVIEFVYPYFEGEDYLGFSISHFQNTVKSHGDTSKIELVVMALKGVMLKKASSL